jgi:GTPase SAR1 family protein
MKNLEKSFENVKGLPVVICGNKVDLENKRKIGSDDLQKYVKDFGFDYIETSAKTGKNVATSFESLTRKVVKFRKTHNIKDGKDKKCIIS